MTNSGPLDGTVHLYYDGGRLVEEYLNSEATPHKEHVWGLSYIDELVQTTVDGSAYYALTDGKYCVLGLIDASGDWVERYEYTPDGRRQVYISAGSNDPDARTPTSQAPRRVVSTIQKPYALCTIGFQGLMHDAVTGNVYQRAREYSPRLGRFMQRDPHPDIYPDGMNAYAAYHVLHGGVDPFGEAHSDIAEVKSVSKDGWRYIFSTGMLNGSLGPEVGKEASSSFILSYIPNQNYWKQFDKKGILDCACNEVRFVQIYYMKVSGGNTNLPVDKWVVDAEEDAKDYPYYPFGTWRDPSKPIKGSKTGRVGGSSSMHDTPGVKSRLWKLNNFSQSFEVCAVCSSTNQKDPKGYDPHKNAVLGCLEWGHAFSFHGNRFNRKVGSGHTRWVNSITWKTNKSTKIERMTQRGELVEETLGSLKGETMTYHFHQRPMEPSPTMKKVLTKLYGDELTDK